MLVFLFVFMYIYMYAMHCIILLFMPYVNSFFAKICIFIHSQLKKGRKSRSILLWISGLNRLR